MNKPAGFTSHDVVAKLRGILKTRKIGHGGTLDPMATGVLPVFIGGATRAADYAAAQNKEYEAGFVLGVRTEKRVTASLVSDALHQFMGPQEQIPPMYSAIKIDGQKLYDLARRGVEIARPARPITIHHIELLSFDEASQQGVFRVTASKGTYVRTIIDDLGERLGTYAAMNSLIRTRSGNYSLAEAYGFEQVEQAAHAGTISSLLHPTDGLFSEFPPVALDAYGYKRALSGAFIAPEHAENMPMQQGALCRVYYNDQFLMLGRIDFLQRGGLALFVYKNFR